MYRTWPSSLASSSCQQRSKRSNKPNINSSGTESEMAPWAVASAAPPPPPPSPPLLTMSSSCARVSDALPLWFALMRRSFIQPGSRSRPKTVEHSHVGSTTTIS